MDPKYPTVEPKGEVQKTCKADDAVDIKLEQMDPSYEVNYDSIQFEEVKVKNWVECGSSECIGIEATEKTSQAVPFRDELGIKLETDVLNRIKDEYNTEQSDEHNLRADADGEVKMEEQAAVGCEEVKLGTQKDSTKTEDMDATEITEELNIEPDGTSNAEGALKKKIQGRTHGLVRRNTQKGLLNTTSGKNASYSCDVINFSDANTFKMNPIAYLLEKPFFQYSLKEKEEIKNLGRPKPNLNINQHQKDRIRKFNMSLYEKNNWICGCEKLQALFCFPCVLFRAGGGESAWNRKGVTDLGHINEKIRVHEKSKHHMNNVFSYSLLGKTDILSQLNTAHRQSIATHNEQVSKNRYILNIIINCVRFCGAFELALKGHDETENLSNRGIFHGLIDFSSELDKELKEHFNKASVFKGTSKTIQNEILQCMLTVYHQEVTKEIKQSDFAAIIVDETTDVSNHVQLVIVLRYIASGKPVERFWNFVNPSGRNADSIASSILQEIDPLFSETPEKLVSQSYDGASVMSGVLNGVQKIIKDKYPRANYVHYYAHQVNLIMSSAAMVNKDVKIFFAHLTGICSFFSSSTQRTEILDEIVNRRSPRSSPTQWNFHSRGVNTVYEHREDLIRVMETLENDDNINLQSTIEQAGAYKLRLRDKDFIFWLTIFHRIMPHVDIIFEQLQLTNTDAIKAKQDLEMFEKQIQKIRNEMDEIIEELELNFSEDGTLPRKKSRHDFSFYDKKREALEVCDTIIQQIKIRFSFTGQLLATKLFEVEKFPTYRRHFPHDLLSEIINNYPFLEKSRLKTELVVLYERRELRTVSGAISFLTLVSQDEARQTFQETVKLLGILVTTPMTTSEAERCFSMLKRVKTFLRNSMKEERLNALGMLSTEKSFLSKIDNFNNRVIDLFANQEERRMDFIYRS